MKHYKDTYEYIFIKSIGMHDQLSEEELQELCVKDKCKVVYTRLNDLDVHSVKSFIAIVTTNKRISSVLKTGRFYVEDKLQRRFTHDHHIFWIPLNLFCMIERIWLGYTIIATEDMSEIYEDLKHALDEIYGKTS